MIAVILLTIALIVSFAVIKYLYLELKTYIYFENIEELQEALIAADDAFENIFKTVKACGNILFALMILSIIIEMFNNQLTWKYVLTGIGIIALAFVSLLFINKEKVKTILKFTDSIGKKTSSYFVFGYIALLGLFCGLIITFLSLNSNQSVKIQIKESSKVPMEIELQKFQKPMVYINITNTLLNHKERITLSEKDLAESFIEVAEKNKELKSRGEIEHFINNLSDETDNLNITTARYSHKYTVNLGKYLAKGKNEVEVIVFSKDPNNKKIVHFVTTIVKGKNTIEVSEKYLDIEL